MDPEGGSREREPGGREKLREENPGTEHGEGGGKQRGVTKGRNPRVTWRSQRREPGE